MPRGAWDTNGFPTTWWDVDGNVAGWWDKDAIPFPEPPLGDETPSYASPIARRAMLVYQAPSDDFVPTTFAIDDQGPVNLAPAISFKAPDYLVPEDNVTLPLPIDDEGFVPRTLRIRPLLVPYTFDTPEWVPPKPVPPKPPRPKPQRPPIPKSTGGNAVFITGAQLARVPTWMLTLYDEPEPKEEELIVAETMPAVSELVADLAIMHAAPQGAAVKALASGTVQTHTDAKGRESVVLNADDGTRYWYADVGTIDVKDGAHVTQGETVAHTKPNARPLPDMIAPREGPRFVLEEKQKLLLPSAGGGLPPTKPAQIVFVEPPREEMYPASKMYARLVPIQTLAEAPPNEVVVPPSTTAANVLRVLAPFGVLAAIMIAIKLLEPRERAKPKRKRKRKKR